MGGRGTYAAGKSVPYTYETIGFVDDVKVLFGIPGTGLHDLPAESHSSNMYIKLHKDGTLNMLRIYDDEHFLTTEIAYHPEPDLTGNHKPVLHIHHYDRDFKRTTADYLDYDTFKKYEKYLVGRRWYSD
ncbi:hypothetical protein [Methanobrevibacter sp.]|uniref:hypothetical protein n=1 Tax=Methanobrevibacter sp. TaxID=66852 RepID=UPI0038664C2C